jgi:hypothetical protein
MSHFLFKLLSPLKNTPLKSTTHQKTLMSNFESTQPILKIFLLLIWNENVPHPILLAKSFPVPMGNTLKIIDFRLIPDLMVY